MKKSYIFKHAYNFVDKLTVNYYIISLLELSMEITKPLAEVFYLEKNEHKAKLLEILLVVGALIFAFNKLDVSYMINFYFLLFMFTSIVYFIILMKEQSDVKNKFSIAGVKSLNALIITMSFSFSLTLSDSLRILLENIISEYEFLSKSGMLSTIPLFLSMVYTFVFGLIIYSALRFKGKK